MLDGMESGIEKSCGWSRWVTGTILVIVMFCCFLRLVNAYAFSCRTAWVRAESNNVLSGILDYHDREGLLPRDLTFMESIPVFSDPWDDVIWVGSKESSNLQRECLVEYWPDRNAHGQYIVLRYEELGDELNGALSEGYNQFIRAALRRGQKRVNGRE